MSSCSVALMTIKRRSGRTWPPSTTHNVRPASRIVRARECVRVRVRVPVCVCVRAYRQHVLQDYQQEVAEPVTLVHLVCRITRAGQPKDREDHQAGATSITGHPLPHVWLHQRTDHQVAHARQQRVVRDTPQHDARRAEQQLRAHAASTLQPDLVPNRVPHRLAPLSRDTAHTSNRAADGETTRGATDAAGDQ